MVFNVNNYVGYRIPRHVLVKRARDQMLLTSSIQIENRIESLMIDPSRYAALKVRGGLPRGPGTAGFPGPMRPDGLFAPRRLKFMLLSGECILPRKEVIQPHVPVRLPCYDFTPLTLHTFDASPLAVGPAASGADDSGGVTGGVYKARERIHRGVLIRDY